MPVDRDDTLKRVEQLLKQGKLPAAIQEYLRLVEDRPNDWNAANALGDLYVKTGEVDRAAEQFTRVADHLYGEGFLPRSAAVYKKVLKIRGDDDHAIWQLADIAGRNGLLLDARSHYARLIRDRRSRGDERGAVDCLIRLGQLEDADVDTRMTAARALTERGESKQAAKVVLRAAEELARQGRAPEALEALTHAAQLDPEDQEIREKLSAAAVQEGPALVAPPPMEQAPPEPEPVWTEPEPVSTAPQPVVAEAPMTQEEPVEEPAGEDLGVALSVAEAVPDAAPDDPPLLESIFQELHAQVAQKQQARAREQYEHGLRHLDEGRVDEAVASLEEAARTPTMRFEAAASLARICIGRHEFQAGVQWMERASEAPAPTPDAGFALLYELASALEQLGETARALAVLMEIEADATDYRDVRDRIAVLSQVQAGNRET